MAVAPDDRRNGDSRDTFCSYGSIDRQAMADVRFGLPFRFARQDQSFLDPPSFPRTVAMASVHESPPIIRLDLLAASWLFFVIAAWLLWGTIAWMTAMSTVRRCEPCRLAHS